MLQPTQEAIFAALSTVMDPETHINIVDMGFIRKVTLLSADTSQDGRDKIYVTYTLTTPGCPLAGTIQARIKESLHIFPGYDQENDIYTELTFDPPWTLGDMSEEARAELGF